MSVLRSPTSCAPPRARAEGPPRVLPFAVAGLLAVVLVAIVGSTYGAKFGVLLVIGLGLGVALYHARFGFTSAWRQLIAVGNGTGLRAHTLLLGTTAALVALIAVTGAGLFGSTPELGPDPIGLALIAGAAVFAVGMQLGGACASGTLFAVGSGQLAIVLTLGGFIAGSLFYTWAMFPFLETWPAVSGVSMPAEFGWFGSLAITIVVLLLIVWGTRVLQGRRNPPPVSPPPSAQGWARVLRGSWPLWVGALVLAVLAAAVVLVSGSTWGVTFPFALWGAKAAQLVGLEPESWAYWQEAKNAKALNASVFTNTGSLTNFGIMLGAAVAAALAGTWSLRSSIPWRTAVAAVLGGLLMGIGARMAGGCNIGAYLGGISTGSLHGWLWGAAALGGTWVGLKLRPVFGLRTPKPTDSTC